jgi:hypothetical protein
MMERFLSDCRERGADAFNEFMESDTAKGRSTFGYLDLTGFPAVVEIERAYLPAEALKKYEETSGEYDPMRNFPRPGA